jgi:hypothetical protein
MSGLGQRVKIAGLECATGVFESLSPALTFSQWGDWIVSDHALVFRRVDVLSQPLEPRQVDESHPLFSREFHVDQYSRSLHRRPLSSPFYQGGTP